MKALIPSLKSITAVASLILSMVNPSRALSQTQLEIRKAESTAGDRTNRRAEAENAPAAVGNIYRVQANDILELRVFQEEDLSGRVRVREDGTVRLPLINETVSVGGMSITSVENKIRDLLGKDYLRDPRVTVNVAEFSKITITIMGQVNRGGTFALPNNKPVTLLQAIGTAGGYTRLANPRKVYLKRTINGEEKVWEINAKELARNPKVSPVLLRDGDVIDVKEAGF